MKDDQVAEKVEKLSAPAPSGATDALAAELNTISERDRAALAREFDEKYSGQGAKDAKLPDLELWGHDPRTDLKQMETFTDQNGIRTTTDSEGGILIEYPDGTTISRDKRGNVLRHDPDGTRTEVSSDGSYRITHPDGKTERGIFC